MKKPYYVTYTIEMGKPMHMPVDVEVGKLHGADIIVSRIKEAIKDKLHNKGFDLKDKIITLNNICRL